ncbi:trehalose-phosphatase [Corynebacterium sp. HMSC072G08]|uniref:trehalose-phosphatase n=1 Tax=Corynebacterium sp. HMSC072G08 TaxID=1715039 RepID=UPI0008A4F198|nr:trehalose-phosphatase [Corynebacterium sp. HMSC072G08]OFN44680.1 trehalose-phosphatase [Corynebacterium sp. HMSC072G08]
MTDQPAFINELARTPRLAVVSDFDGTLASFATDPYAVQADPRSLAALERLAQLPDTWAAVLSGRHLEGLARVCPLHDPVIFGGSHGAETAGPAGATPVTPEQQAFLDDVEAQLHPILAQFPGAEIEYKPFQRVLHVLKLHLQDPAAARAALDAALALDLPGVEGKMVVEFSASSATKGSWIQALRERLGATAVVFLGDDVTDETGFAALTQLPAGPDLGIKVGEGETTAVHRVPGVDAVADFLTDLAAARAEFLGR